VRRCIPRSGRPGGARQLVDADQQAEPIVVG
jgi:hypothetical protein